MTLFEALAWTFEVAGEYLDPFEGSFDEREQTMDWCCYGCLGVFISQGPEWRKPTDVTFPHEPGCKYLAARAASRRTRTMTQREFDQLNHLRSEWARMAEGYARGAAPVSMRSDSLSGVLRTCSELLYSCVRDLALEMEGMPRTDGPRALEPGTTREGE